MIIDANCFLGHYPFRSLRHNTADSLLALMDRNGVDQAIVSSLHAVFYRNAQRGNEELHDETKPFRDRLIPIAAVNPKYVGWIADLEQAAEQWRMRGVTLWPAHHGYDLRDEFGQAALERIEQLGLPLVLTQRLEDRRQRHHWDIAEDLEQQAVLEIARSNPQLKIFLCNWNGLDGDKLAAAGLKGRVLIDFARLDVMVRGSVPKLIDSLGADSIAFGTHAPFDYMGPSLVKLESVAELAANDLENIAWRNTSQFFQLSE